MDVNVTLDKTTVAVGETITANWTVTGGLEPYTSRGYWAIELSNGNKTYTKTVDIQGTSSSFTPVAGVKCLFGVHVTGANGDTYSRSSGYIPITGEASVEPMSIDIALDKTTVAVGETITANWTVTGGIAPYTYEYRWMSWGVGGWSSDFVETSEASVSFTPRVGTGGYLCVSVSDASKYTKGFESSFFTITGAPSQDPLTAEITLDKSSVALGSEITASWTVTGGIAPYSYSYSWVSIEPDAPGLEAGKGTRRGDKIP